MGDDATSLIMGQLRGVRTEQADMTQRPAAISQRLDAQAHGPADIATTAAGALVADRKDIKDRLVALETA